MYALDVILTNYLILCDLGPTDNSCGTPGEMGVPLMERPDTKVVGPATPPWLGPSLSLGTLCFRPDCFDKIDTVELQLSVIGPR